MALVDTTWYCNFGNGTSTGYYAVTVRPQNTAVVAGVLRRQFTAPAVTSERVFVCIIAGTTANVTDATWVLTRGAKTTDGTATWMECSGQAGLNGDLTNTATWAQVKAATPAVLGQVIKRSNNASYQICTTAGAMSASEPTFSDTAGVTTTDTTAVWTSLGPVSNFTGGQAPHARLANAFVSTWFAAGNTIYVGDNHAETQASGTSGFGPFSGSASTIGKILCHAQAGPYPPTSLATGATLSTTATGTILLTVSGPTYIYGLTFSAGVGSATSVSLSISPNNGSWAYFDNCAMKLATTATTSTIIISQGSYSTVIFNNTTASFAATAQTIVTKVAKFTWQNTGPVLAGGSVVPTNFLTTSGTTDNLASVVLEAIDLSQLTGNIWIANGGTSIGDWLIKDCKLNATGAIPTPLNTGLTVQLVRSSS